MSIRASNPASWFWKLYLDKIERKAFEHGYTPMIKSLDDKQLAGLIDLLQELKISYWQARSLTEEIESQLQQESITEIRRNLLNRLQGICKTQDDDLTTPNESILGGPLHSPYTEA